ncbi:MAG: RluA family pseudouridine synthase [Eubacteriaceae bacterium]|nr:RluA family pseudouridine synthase [Eubacteriaceae bacterium]
MERELIINVDSLGKCVRIDQYLSEKIPEHSRNFIKKLIDSDGVLLNGKEAKASSKVKDGDVISLFLPETRESYIEPENIEINVIYEDEDLLVINKAKGMVVHPGHGNTRGTLVNALLFSVGDLSGINGVIRPGIVHRIDKDTSGLLLVAKNDQAHNKLAAQLKKHEIRRNYLAIVEGVIREDKGTIDAPIGRDTRNRIKMAVVEQNSKRAVTHFEVLKRFPKHTMIEAKLETGRTHQIRVHMSYIGHPLVGDKVYGHKKQTFTDEGQVLHAYKIGFTHPTTGDYMEFETEVPEYFKKIIRKIS